MADRTRDSSSETGECLICRHPYDVIERIPKLLTCHHTLCVFCADRLKHGRSIKCPTCRHVTKTTSQGILGLQTNFYLQQQRMPSQSNEDTIAKGTAEKCPRHDREFTFFCRTHNKAVCNQCLLLSHRRGECEIAEIVEVRVAMQRQLTELVVKTDTEMHELEKSLQGVTECREVLAASKEIAERRIDDVFERWKKAEKKLLDSHFLEVDKQLRDAEREVKVDLEGVTAKGKLYRSKSETSDVETMANLLAGCPDNARIETFEDPPQITSENVLLDLEKLRLRYNPPNVYHSRGDILMKAFKAPKIEVLEYPDVIVEREIAQLTFQVSREDHVPRDGYEISLGIINPTLGFRVSLDPTHADSTGRHVASFHVLCPRDSWLVLRGSVNVAFRFVIRWGSLSLLEGDFLAEVVGQSYNDCLENEPVLLNAI